MKKHIINAIVGLSLAIIFLFLTLRNKPLDEIFVLLKEARLNWILISIAMLSMIFVLRSIRWKLILNNAGENPRIRDVAYSLLLGTFINSFTPKLGEVVRCTSLEKSSGIGTSKVLGTVITDRVYDLLALFLGIILILLFESDRLGSLVVEAFRNLFRSLSNNFAGILIIVFIAILVLVSLWLIARRLGVAEKIREFGKGVASTAKMTFRIKNSRNFALQTLLIWIIMILMNYACLRALPSTDSLSLYFAMVTLFIGTIGWAIPSPGGIGTSHFFILQLFILFGLNKETGVAYGILVNGLQVFITILAGSLTISIVYIFRLIKRAKNSDA